jgi:hypothetical protein
MATTHTVKQLAIFRQEGQGGIHWNRSPGEESSQDWVAGTPLVEDDSTMELEEDTSAGTDKVVGIAAHAASGTAGTAVGYYEANPYNLFVGTLRNGSSAIALATTHINTAYGLLVDATGNTYIDVSNTSQKKVQVVGPAPGHEIGDTNARVIFRFLTDMQQKLGAVTAA